ncbi:MAG: hypothetical protein GY888_07515, partial [Planctomycetaceae bacterium]|nr:hypothetical protein [Planctomycetaceae bacterium]
MQLENEPEIDRDVPPIDVGIQLVGCLLELTQFTLDTKPKNGTNRIKIITGRFDSGPMGIIRIPENVLDLYLVNRQVEKIIVGLCRLMIQSGQTGDGGCE